MTFVCVCDPTAGSDPGTVPTAWSSEQGGTWEGRRLRWTDQSDCCSGETLSPWDSAGGGWRGRWRVGWGGGRDKRWKNVLPQLQWQKTPRHQHQTEPVTTTSKSLDQSFSISQVGNNTNWPLTNLCKMFTIWSSNMSIFRSKWVWMFLLWFSRDRFNLSVRLRSCCTQKWKLLLSNHQ